MAPPPSVAPGLTRDILLPYYESCRREGRELPILVAFPPSPAGLFYLDVLGQDIEVVNIIPNMISRVGNESVAGEACNLITFPEEHGWPQPDKDELFRFFTPMGRCLEVPPHLIMQVLSTEIAVHPLTGAGRHYRKMPDRAGNSLHLRRYRLHHARLAPAGTPLCRSRHQLLRQKRRGRFPSQRAAAPGYAVVV